MSERLEPADILCAAAERYEQQKARLLDLYDRAYDLIEKEGEIVGLTSEQTDGPWIISITRTETIRGRKIDTRIYVECKSLSKEIPPKYDKYTSVYCEWRSEKGDESSPWNRSAELKVSTENGTKRCTFEIKGVRLCEDEMLVDHLKEIALVSDIMSEFLEAPETSD